MNFKVEFENTGNVDLEITADEDIGHGTTVPIPAGGRAFFQVDNTYPGGDPRTPGYWKNWNYGTGEGKYLSSKHPDYAHALELAEILDQCNNGELCTQWGQPLKDNER